MWRWSGPTSLIAGTFVLFDSGWEPEDPGACCEDRQAAAIGRPIPSGVGSLRSPTCGGRHGSNAPNEQAESEAACRIRTAAQEAI